MLSQISRRFSFCLAVSMVSTSVVTAAAILFVGWRAALVRPEVPHAKTFVLATMALVFTMGATKTILGLQCGAFWKWGLQQTLLGWINHFLDLATDVAERYMSLEKAMILVLVTFSGCLLAAVVLLAEAPQFFSAQASFSVYALTPLFLLAIDSLDYNGMFSRGEEDGRREPPRAVL